MSTDLVPVTDYPVMQLDVEEASAAIQEVATDGVSRFDLPVVKVPSGGGIAWEIPDADGGVETKQVLEGIVLAVQDQRTYWKEAFGTNGGGTPPDCYSLDLKTGYGDPGGDCLACPFAQFGSGVDDKGNETRGQACKQQKIIWLLTPYSLLPYIVVVPPTSLKTVKSALVQMAGQGLRPGSYRVALSLDKQKNAGGVTYAQIVMKSAGKLSPEEKAQVQPMKDMVAGLTGQVVDVRPDEAAA